MILGPDQLCGKGLFPGCPGHRWPPRPGPSPVKMWAVRSLLAKLTYPESAAAVAFAERTPKY